MPVNLGRTISIVYFSNKREKIAIPFIDLFNIFSISNGAHILSVSGHTCIIIMTEDREEKKSFL